jgi:hypothetical protein
MAKRNVSKLGAFVDEQRPAKRPREDWSDNDIVDLTHDDDFYMNGNIISRSRVLLLTDTQDAVAVQAVRESCYCIS